MSNLSESMVIHFKKMVEGAKSPTKAYHSDAGWDLYASERVYLSAGDLQKIPTGIAVAIPEGYVGVIKDRSSMGSKRLKVFGGIIDAQYRGEAVVMIYNGKCPTTADTYIIEKGDKIAQMLILPVPDVEFVEVFDLGETDRGESGFGSSGK